MGSRLNWFLEGEGASGSLRLSIAQLSLECCGRKPNEHQLDQHRCLRFVRSLLEGAGATVNASDGVGTVRGVYRIFGGRFILDDRDLVEEQAAA